MEANLLSLLLEQSDYYTEANTEGLTQQDSLVEAPNGGNSLNWILGHMVFWRNEILSVAGGQLVWTNGTGTQYRGNPGERRPKEFDSSQALPLQQLVADFRSCGQRLAARLKNGSFESEIAGKIASLLLH